MGKKPKEKRVNLCTLVTFKWHNGQRVLKSNRPEITVRILKVNDECKSLRFVVVLTKHFLIELPPSNSGVQQSLGTQSGKVASAMSTQSQRVTESLESFTSHDKQ